MTNPWEIFGDDETAARRLAEWLLVKSLDDLAWRSRPEADAYERLGISAILRRLMLDKRPVLHRARARLALPEPTFAFTPHVKPHEDPDAQLRLLVSFGRIAAQPSAVTGGLEEFLTATAAYHFGQPVSVKEVIRNFAHAHGGVHLGTPESPFERAVQRVSATLTLDATGWTNVLSEFAAVTIAALTPLADELKANPYPPPGE